MSTQQIIASGRPPVAAGLRHAVGLVIRPDQMLQLLHDFLPNAPIPFDAVHTGLGVDEAERTISFYFESAVNPLENCVVLDPHHFLRILVQAGHGLLPADAELDGIELSSKFTVMLLRVKSDRFPPHPGDDLPVIHLRYEAGELYLLNVWDAVKKERRIQISD